MDLELISWAYQWISVVSLILEIVQLFLLTISRLTPEKHLGVILDENWPLIRHLSEKIARANKDCVKVCQEYSFDCLQSLCETPLGLCMETFYMTIQGKFPSPKKLNLFTTMQLYLLLRYHILKVIIFKHMVYSWEISSITQAQSTF